MKRSPELDLINQLLSSVPKKHQNSAEQMLYERGYLTGLLASLMAQDSQLKSRIIKRTEQLLKNSGRS